nr:peptidase M1 [Flavobacterium sp.]
MKIRLLLVLLSLQIVHSQPVADDVAAIAASEMKGASSLINFVANPNTQNYDVTAHELRFTVDPNIPQRYISGTVTTIYTALADMSSITFDLADELIVASVTSNGAPLAFSQSDDELIITLSGVQPAGMSSWV